MKSAQVNFELSPTQQLQGEKVAIPMKTLEILVIGGPKAGKSSLADAILHHKSQEEANQEAVGCGMRVKKEEINLPSGETLRLCIWDPQISMLPKEREQETVRRTELAKKVQEEQHQQQQRGFFSKLWSGDLFTKQKAQVAVPEVETNPLEKVYVVDTNRDLALDYIKSGTYHSVIFVFDPSLLRSPVGEDPSERCSFQHMEAWLDIFRALCFKSSDYLSIAVVGNRRETKEDHIENLIKIEKTNTELETDNMPSEVIQEWIASLREELGIPEYKPVVTSQRRKQKQRQLQYFEVDVKNGRGIGALRKWVIEQAMRRYKYVERRRYMRRDVTIEVADDNNEKVDKRMCGGRFEMCTII